MRTAGLLAVMLIGSATTAAAEDLPRFDVQTYCAANGGERGGAATCQRAEEASRVAIAARWTSFPKQRKHFCVQSVTFRPKEQRSYATLAECLDVAKTS